MKHKFFERYLDNDLNDLWNFLDIKYDELLNGTMKEGTTLSPVFKERYFKTDVHGAPSDLLNKYNVFDFNHPGIEKLEHAIKDMVKEACTYYNLDFDSQNYVIHGWWNQNAKNSESDSINPIVRPELYHDHLGGRGAPDFHGYYCVNAEPSITYYLIDGVTLFENHNKNNRAILSETGQKHARDNWYDDKHRITIAYDIIPDSYRESITKSSSKFRSFK